MLIYLSHLINKRFLFYLIIIFIQFSSIISNPKKSYNKSITNKTESKLNLNINNTNLNQSIIEQKKLEELFKNIPFKAIEEAKQRDLRRVKINRILVFIIILLAISIIISTVYDIYKKIMIIDYSSDIKEIANM